MPLVQDGGGYERGLAPQEETKILQEGDFYVSFHFEFCEEKVKISWKQSTQKIQNLVNKAEILSIKST